MKYQIHLNENDPDSEYHCILEFTADSHYISDETRLMHFYVGGYVKHIINLDTVIRIHIDKKKDEQN